MVLKEDGGGTAADRGEVLVSARGVTKVYRTGQIESPALRGVDLEVRAGEFLAVVGPSGSGKTTLLNLIGALDSVTDGRLSVFGQEVGEMSRRGRADMRLHRLGFVFQAYNLVPVLTARENVEFILELQGAGRERSARAVGILEELGLAEFAGRRPNQLSGGQQQRVAVARAVASRPRLVLADEPTANLDGENAEALLRMMRELNRERGITFIFSTHDPRVVAHARRVVRLVDGRVASDEVKEPKGLGSD
ncbi:MAG: ABC transporter ATP-binding protein [Planctomycetota bacterium]|jgi:putative ABC transport system ATP-binding protein